MTRKIQNKDCNLKDIFITSPIYYVNDIPHIGHAYTTIATDMFKKYQNLKGNNAILLTGTDEHGQKIENSAKAKGKAPQQYADEISAKFRTLWDNFAIDYDYFVRTTDDYHDLGVKCAFEIMQQKGDIYKGQYEGNYCVSCETFFTKRQLIDGAKCPDCGKITKEIKEESYFFALSKYEKRLLAWYAENPNVILPAFKRNEIIKFVENGLSDLSITRSTFSWGIALPQSAKDTSHIIYVWLDALLSYITPLGFGNTRKNQMSLFENAHHFVGKDILKFHAIFWPAFLMSLNLPLPKRIFTHGWWLIEGAKMSKSVGNVINPKAVADAYGVEVLRYFLLREVPFGQDGDFAIRALVERANAELSDSLGNLLNRLLGMSEKYFDLRLEAQDFTGLKFEQKSVDSIIDSLDNLMENMTPNRYLEELWKLFDLANGLITRFEPWAMIKEGRVREVANLLVFIANILAKSALLLYPILPKSAEAMAHSLGISLESYADLIKNRKYLNRFNLTKIPPLFPKIENIIEAKDLSAEANSHESKSAESLCHSERSEETQKNKRDFSPTAQNDNAPIKIDDFKKIDIRVGRILHAERVPKSEKLLVFQIDFGEFGKRQIISGIAQFYAPQSLIGKHICAIVNLKPTKIMGVESCGMLLTTEDSSGVKLLFADSNAGSKIS
ncbi:methionine--tRNA ligase [Helicobacter sp. 23-1045]